MPSDQRIPTAVIGCGTVAQYGHLPAIAETPGLQLTAIADVSAQAVKEVSEQYAVEGYTDYHELLARPDIVGVTVSTPLPYHYEVAAAAMKAGKHVFLEKPFADTPDHCRELVDLSRKYDRMLAVNFEYRFDEGILKMRELLQSGELGKLQVMRFINNWSAHGVQGAAGERRARFMQYGGGAMDCGIHFMDLARFVSDSEFKTISSYGHWAEPEYRGPGHILIQARMKSGVLAFIESSFIYTHRSKGKGSFMQYEAIGDRGVVSWGTPLRTPGSQFAEQHDELHILTEDRSEVLRFSTEKQFSKTYNEWAACLARGAMEGSQLANSQDGSQATIWMWEALKQAEREREENDQDNRQKSAA